MAGVGPVERMHRAEEKFEARRNGEGDVVRVVGHGVRRHESLVDRRAELSRADCDRDPSNQLGVVAHVRAVLLDPHVEARIFNVLLPSLREVAAGGRPLNGRDDDRSGWPTHPGWSTPPAGRRKAGGVDVDPVEPSRVVARRAAVLRRAQAASAARRLNGARLQVANAAIFDDHPGKLLCAVVSGLARFAVIGKLRREMKLGVPDIRDGDADILVAVLRRNADDDDGAVVAATERHRGRRVVGVRQAHFDAKAVDAGRWRWRNRVRARGARADVRLGRATRSIGCAATSALALAET